MSDLSRIKFYQHSPDFQAMRAAPCPMLREKNRCLVYDVRPYNCRRFGCLRPDPETEVYRPAPISTVAKFGNVGCANLRERLVQSRIARNIYGLLQRRAQTWARAHGWTEGME